MIARTSRPTIGNPARLGRSGASAKADGSRIRASATAPAAVAREARTVGLADKTTREGRVIPALRPPATALRPDLPRRRHPQEGSSGMTILTRPSTVGSGATPRVTGIAASLHVVGRRTPAIPWTAATARAPTTLESTIARAVSAMEERPRPATACRHGRIALSWLSVMPPPTTSVAGPAGNCSSRGPRAAQATTTRATRPSLARR